MAKFRLQVLDLQIPPRELRESPVANQISYLDKIRHVSEPDFDAFISRFHIEQFLLGGELK